MRIRFRKQGKPRGSLVNEVLRDMDARRRQRPGPRERALGALQPVLDACPRPPKGWRPALRSGVGAEVGLWVLVFAAGAVAWLSAPDAGSDRRTRPVDVASAPLPMVAPPVLAAPEVARIAPTPKGPPAPPAQAVLPSKAAPPSSPAAAPPRATPRRNRPVARPARPASRPKARAERTNRTERVYAEALALAERGEDRQARKQLVHCLALEPAHRNARAALATLLARGGDRAAAVALLVEGRRRLGEPAAFAILEARIRLDMDDLSGAAALLEDEASVLYGRADALALLATIHQRRGHHGQAARRWAQALRLDEGEARWWMGLGISREAQGRRAEALEAYRGAFDGSGLDNDTRAWLARRIAALSGSGPGHAKRTTP